MGKSLWGAAALLWIVTSACVDSGGRSAPAVAESCMTCHNGSQRNDYSGPGMENPHPFPGAMNLRCTTCHGGNPNSSDPNVAHVPPPPEIGDEANLTTDPKAYFNRLTLTGLDKIANYQANGRTYTALDFLQFINPGDLRVVTQSRSCGNCHDNYAQSVARSLLATEAGILSGAMYAAGLESTIPGNQGLYQNTAVDSAFRAVSDANFDSAVFSSVASVDEYPVYSVKNQPGSIHNNNAYLIAGLVDDDQFADGRLVPGSELADLYHEQVAFTCGDCHLGSAGANNRYGDFRSSGCTACHMRRSLSGRSTSTDPNVNKVEPADPDQIREPEMSHVKRHLISSIAKTLPGGEQVQGIDDYTCAGCHQGSNRTVMQYWGIRLDQNQDVHRGFQYPAQPDSFQRTSGDTRLFDPVVGNNTFNGRNNRQYLRREDYDGDTLDDTPPDVHYEAGLGCIDCHGSWDLHGGDVTDRHIPSRMEHGVAIACENCHGAANAYAAVQQGSDYDGNVVDLAVDEEGNPLRHVWRDASGDYWLRSRLTGTVHYIKQTLDTVVDNGRLDPGLNPIYSQKASYAMGRADGNPATGVGPKQTGGINTPNFSHTDNMSCASCHASWTNNCIGCHLEGRYDGGNNNFSNITGDTIVFEERFADFTYQTPVPFQLGVGPRNKIEQISPNTLTFFRYVDRLGQRSGVFSFSDRHGKGSDPQVAGELASLSHNVIMPHSIRGKVNGENEGPRYCVACHLTTDSTTPALRASYDTFRSALQPGGNLANLDFNLLRDEIGLNTGNQNNTPYWVHMVAGLGSGLFIFDQNGCPINPLDFDPNRRGCDNPPVAINNNDLANAYFNLDRIVDENGVALGSNNHAIENPGPGGSALRQGSADPFMAGPLGGYLVQLLADPDSGVVLDSWLDADADPGGDAATNMNGP